MNEVKFFCVLGLIAMLTFYNGCIQGEPVVDSSSFSGDSCDALKPCPTGFECATFPGEGLQCYPADKWPCDLVSCPLGKECVVAESYPVQIFCS
jgi:hypothetical protein